MVLVVSCKCCIDLICWVSCFDRFTLAHVLRFVYLVACLAWFVDCGLVFGVFGV